MKKYRKYKGVTVNSFGLPVFNVKDNDNNQTKSKYLHTFFTDLKDEAPKNLIVMYDIPSERKIERDWFRRSLQRFGFVMIQKSVWVGPSPLPKDFLDYVSSLKLNNQLKSFKLAKPYTGEERIF